MRYNCFYYSEQDKVIITSSSEKLTLDNLTPNDLRIDISTKEVERIFEFFKFITVNAIMSEDSLIELNYESITDEDFYQEDSFVKLKELFDDLVTIANETLAFSRNPETTETEQVMSE